MRITDLTKADAQYRLWRKAQTLYNSIRRQEAYYTNKHYDRTTIVHLLRSLEAQRNLLQYLETGQDAGEINSILSSRQLKLKPVKETLAHIFEGLPKPTPAQLNDFQHALVEEMNEKGVKSRAEQHTTILTYEIAHKAQHGYYMLFNTLTVQRGAYNLVFNKKSTEFKEYIRRFNRLVGNDNTYFAVVEEGGKNGRLHIHVLHFFKTLPKQAQDPNKYLPKPNLQELACIKPLWPHGWSTPIIVRYAANDAWGQSHYRWPTDPKTKEARTFGSPLRLATYMSKYIMKSYHSNKRDEYLWRVRKSHSLGQTILEELLSTLDNQDLLNIATNETINTKLNNKIIPPSLLRLQALRSYQNRSSTLPSNASLTDMGKHITPRLSPLRYSPDSIHSTQMNNQQNIGVTRINNTPAEASFNETVRKLQQSAERINEQYFRQPTGLYGTTTTRDYLYG